MTYFFFSLALLFLLGLTVVGQENVLLLRFSVARPEALQALSHSGHSVGVSVSDEDLNVVSRSVLKAENWLRTHVLAQFPASDISAIIVGNTLCHQNGQDHNLASVLPAAKNIYYSLTRWGLERVIQVSVAFSANCFEPQSALFKEDISENVIKQLLEFLVSINSTYSIVLPSNMSPLSEETLSLVSSRVKFTRKIESLWLERINVIQSSHELYKHKNRRLSTVDSKVVNPYPARPTPLPVASQPPLHSSIGFSIPAHIAKNPVPPEAHIVSPPPLSIPRAAPPPFSMPDLTPPPFSMPDITPPPFSMPDITPPPLSIPDLSPPPMVIPFAPTQPPFTNPRTPPYGQCPPCNPGDSAPAPETQVTQKLWCVAKPSVPAETLQEAMDYACGAGGADCEGIQPHGNCFNPDTVVAHASYAFNSYWQKTKRHGGTCSFGGTAMLIDSDPSFLHCRFVLS